MTYYRWLPWTRIMSTASKGRPLGIPEDPRSNIPVNPLKEVAASFKRPQPDCRRSPSGEKFKTSFRLFMVCLLSFVRLIASLRDRCINPDSLSSFPKEGQR